MIFEQQSYLFRFVILVIKHCLRQTHIEDLLLRRRVDNRDAMDAILFVLRTGCQWNALNATGICTSSSAHRRFQEWRDAGVFEQFWQNGLIYRGLIGVRYQWMAARLKRL